MNLLTWAGIVLCLTQSAIFSGLNLAFFSVSKLELSVAAKKGDPGARRMLALRENSNLMLVTILWGNVAVNVLLALLSGSVLTAVGAFLFSTIIITLFAEIIPQAYFSRHAITMGSRLAPLLRFYQVLLYPVAAPSAMMLDKWLGPEAVRYFRERDLHEVIKLHMESADSDIERIEGQGALNFLDLDDVRVSDEGEILDPKSIIQMEFQGHRPLFPPIEPRLDNEFLQTLNDSHRKWIVLVDSEQEPRLVLDSNDFIIEALFRPQEFNPLWHCHRPIVVRDFRTKLGDLIGRFRIRPRHGEDDVVENDVLLLWGDEKRLISGTDILGRLLRGIVRRDEASGVPAGEAGNARA